MRGGLPGTRLPVVWQQMRRLALLADLAQHEEPRRHAVELLAELFADALERLAAGAVRRPDVAVALDYRAASAREASNRTACVAAVCALAGGAEAQRFKRAISKFSASFMVGRTARG